MKHTTIAAVSTPPGVGGIAVIRLSGADALQIADRIWNGKKLSKCKSHSVHLGYVVDSKGETLDHCLATVFRAPNSFTGEDTVEFSIHGSRYVQSELLTTLCKAGAQIAEPGEFTQRAFTSGHLNLTQAEAIADVIASQSPAAHRLAMSQLKGNLHNKIFQLREMLINLVSLMELELDFAEENVEFADRSQLRQQLLEIQSHIRKLLSTYRSGNAILNGIPIAIVGPTNVGKSSLLNSLVDDDRAIVSDIHGTTRDTIEETARIGDFLYRFIDTAGLRETTDSIEQLGIERSLQAIRKAHIIVCVIDLHNPSEGLKHVEKIKKLQKPHQSLLLVYNKSDLCDSEIPLPGVKISALQKTGIETLKEAIVNVTENSLPSGEEDLMVINQRHAEVLNRAAQAAESLMKQLDTELPTDIVAIEAHAVIDTLSELTGQITSSDILQSIFSRFCIGK